MPSAPLDVPSPPWGGGAIYKKKQKNTRGEKRLCIRTIRAFPAVQCQCSRLHDVLLGFVSVMTQKKKIVVS